MLLGSKASLDGWVSSALVSVDDAGAAAGSHRRNAAMSTVGDCGVDQSP